MEEEILGHQAKDWRMRYKDIKQRSGGGDTRTTNGELEKEILGHKEEEWMRR